MEICYNLYYIDTSLFIMKLALAIEKYIIEKPEVTCSFAERVVRKWLNVCIVQVSHICSCIHVSTPIQTQRPFYLIFFLMSFLLYLNQ